MKYRFNDRIIICKATLPCSLNKFEYVTSSESTRISDTIYALDTGEGIASCLQLKSMALTISEKMQVYPKNSWPLTPEAIIESSKTFNKILFSFIAQIVSPKSSIDRDGFVKPLRHKAAIVQQCCENIQATVPFVQRSLSHVFVCLFNNLCQNRFQKTD